MDDQTTHSRSPSEVKLDHDRLLSPGKPTPTVIDYNDVVVISSDDEDKREPSKELRIPKKRGQPSAPVMEPAKKPRTAPSGSSSSSPAPLSRYGSRAKTGRKNTLRETHKDNERLRSEIEKLQRELEQAQRDTVVLEEEVAKTQTEAATATKQIVANQEEQKKQIEELRADLEKKEMVLHDLSQVKAKLETVLLEKQSELDLTADVKRQLADARVQLENKDKQLAKNDAELVSQNVKLRQQNEDVVSMQSALTTAESEKAAAEQTVMDILREKTALEVENKELSSKIDILERNLKDAKAKIDRFKEHTDNCGLLRQPPEILEADLKFVRGILEKYGRPV
ncbi:hypothetical protein DL764_000700 [Monosporascus ibericus]|uniref:Uncharacterized protein n=1 Tax=Monosporascus ibericus TaxID=155417 RepID=A0A4Q4TSF5_9PEZI|nr:hypothetical protein DL764_000700 [Monosporascus ibericus]